MVPEEKRTKCMAYTRVMGYHRPVESFNIGKKGEHKERVYFEEHKNERNQKKNVIELMQFSYN